MSDIEIYTWPQFEIDVFALLISLREKNIHLKVVYGIPKGGLPLAVKIANILKIPLALTLFEANSQVKNQKNILIVDDISDSGTTLLQIPHIHNYTTATLFVRHSTKHRPKFFINELFNEKWICFPWENQSKVKKERDGTMKKDEPVERSKPVRRKW